MALLVSILVLVLAAAVPAVGQREGFLSIDCGLENSSGYQENYYINYVPDGPYVDGGKSYSIVTNNTKPFNTLRSFPSGEQNCYSLPTHSGGKYLVRLGFYYGNYDGKNSSTSALKFDLYLGVNRWTTMENTIGVVYEAIFVAWASWAPVCLVNTGHGTPFVNLVELRRLDDMMYPAVMANQSLGLVQRSNMGGSSFLRTADVDAAAAQRRHDEQSRGLSARRRKKWSLGAAAEPTSRRTDGGREQRDAGATGGFEDQ